MTDMERVIEMYASGMSLKTIGMQLGHSQQYAYTRIKKAGIKLRPLRGSGQEHSQWKGGRLDAGQGYWRVWVDPNDPMASMRTHQGYVLEHRLVVARMIGRPLHPTETVHHIDGDRTNNKPENLQLRQGRHGKGAVMCCLNCGSNNVGYEKIGG